VGLTVGARGQELVTAGRKSDLVCTFDGRTRRVAAAPSSPACALAFEVDALSLKCLQDGVVSVGVGALKLSSTGNDDQKRWHANVGGSFERRAPSPSEAVHGCNPEAQAALCSYYSFDFVVLDLLLDPATVLLLEEVWHDTSRPLAPRIAKPRSTTR
jgi:hypothetical protein